MNQILVITFVILVAALVGRGGAWLITRSIDDSPDPPAKFYSRFDAYRDVSEERKLRILSEVKRRLEM